MIVVSPKKYRELAVDFNEPKPEGRSVLPFPGSSDLYVGLEEACWKITLVDSYKYVDFAIMMKDEKHPIIGYDSTHDIFVSALKSPKDHKWLFQNFAMSIGDNYKQKPHKYYKMIIDGKEGEAWIQMKDGEVPTMLSLLPTNTSFKFSERNSKLCIIAKGNNFKRGAEILDAAIKDGTTGKIEVDVGRCGDEEMITILDGIQIDLSGFAPQKHKYVFFQNKAGQSITMAVIGCEPGSDAISYASSALKKTPTENNFLGIKFTNETPIASFKAGKWRFQFGDVELETPIIAVGIPKEVEKTPVAKAVALAISTFYP